MKRFFICFALLTVLFSVYAETVQISPGDNSAQIISSTALETTIQFRVNSYEKIPVSIDGSQWFAIGLPQEGRLQELGKPELPVMNRSIIIPDNALMKLEVYDIRYQDVELQVAPSKGNLLRDTNPASVPYTFGSIYLSDEFFPKQPATLSEPYILRDFRGITVQTNPFAYNPKAQILRIFTAYKIRVYSDGIDTINTLSRPRIELSRAFETIYENHFLNWENNRYTPLEDSFGKLLVVCHTNFLTQIEPYINWKRQKGIPVELVEFSTIGSTADQLAAYISTRYTDDGIAFVQLVGDAAQIPTLTYYGGASDPGYTMVSGTDSYSDLFIGRFSATTATEVTNQVDKTILYERDLTEASTWLSKATGVASDQGPGDDGEYDYEHMSIIRTRLLNYGYTSVDQVYDPNASSPGLTNFINAGRGWVNYTGHGFETGWSTTWFTNLDVNALTNTNMLPVIMDVACLNGSFTSTTCFAEAWLRKASAGAIAMYASSISQSWSAPMCAQDEATRLVITDSKVTTGGLFYNSAFKMLDEYSSSAVPLIRTWIAFGDISLMYRSKTPSAMVVSFPPFIPIGASSVTVSTGVANALVAITRNNIQCAMGYTNSEGNVTLTITGTPSTPTEYVLTVTAHNKTTFIGTLKQGHIWKGSFSTNWNTPNNWNTGVVPTASDDVIIPTGCLRNPVISSTANCKNLYIEASTMLTVNSATFTVQGDINNYGQFAMNSNLGIMYLNGDFFWHGGSSSLITADSEIYIQGNMEVFAGSNVQMGYGYIEFNGPTDSYLRVYTPTELMHLRSNKSSSAYLYYSAVSTADLTLNGSFWNYNGSTFVFNNSYTMYIKGSFSNYSGGHIFGEAGTLRFIGANNQTVRNQDSSSYFKHFVIDTENWAIVTLENDITIRGNFTLAHGTFQTNSHNLHLHGNYTNSMGSVEFYEGTGQVFFEGATDQICNGEDFYTLVLNKSAGEIIIPNNSQTSCAYYDWVQGAYRVDGGWFVAEDLLDGGIFGTITLNSGNIQYTQDSSSFVDLRGNLTIHNGLFKIVGGSGPSYWPYLDAATLVMDGGTLDFANAGIFINTGNTFTDNISAGVIKTSLGFVVSRNDFNPTGGMIELYGSTDCTLEGGTGSSFYNVKINKASSTAMDNKQQLFYDRSGNHINQTRSNSVSSAMPLDINGSFSILSGSYTAPSLMKVAGNWLNYIGPSAFNEGTGTVEFDGTAHQYCHYDENFYTLHLNKSASFRLNSISTDVTCAKYTWTAGAVDVLSGSFTANDLSQTGIYGIFYANPNGVINLHQDTANWVDLNGFLYNYGGTINIYGGSLPVYPAYSANAGITMTGGTIDFKDQGLIITNRPSTLIIDISGGTIKTVGSYQCTKAGVAFSGGTLELYGSGTVYLEQGPGNSFHDLVINKISTGREIHKLSTQRTKRERERYIDYRLDGVNINSNILVTDTFTISAGTVELGAYTLETYNDILVSGTLKMVTAGNIICGDDFFWHGTSVGLISAGTVSCDWDWHFESGSNVNMTGSSTTLLADYDANITCSSANSWFGNLYVNGGGGGDGSTYYIDPGSLSTFTVTGNLEIFPNVSLILGEIPGHVNGTFSLDNLGAISIGDGSIFTIDGAFNHNGTLDIGPGEFVAHDRYYSADTASLTIDGGSFINDVAWFELASVGGEDEISTRNYVHLRGAINLNSGLLEITNNSVYIQSHATRNWVGGTLRVGSGLTATDANVFHQNGGTLEFIGNNNPALTVNSGNYINHLKVSLGNSWSVYLQTEIIIKGNLLIQTGGIYTNNNAMQIGGTWTNNQGTLAFSEGNSTITFNGSSATTGFTTDETIYNLVLNNSNASWDNFELSAGVDLTVLNDATLTDGTLNLKNSSSLAVSRDVIIANGAGINAYNGSLVNISVGRNWTDSNAATSTSAGYYAGTSTLTINGTAISTVSVGTAAFDLFALSLNKSSASEVRFSKPVKVTSNCSIDNSTWVDTALNLTHEFRGNLTLGASGYWHSNNQNTIAFVGSNNQTFSILSSSQIRGLTVDKSGSSGITVSLGSNILGINSGNVLINAGILDLNGHLFRTTGNVTINSGAKLSIDSDAVLEIANTKALVVNTGGVLEAIGTASHPAKLTRQAGNYACNIESGATISAEYAIFEHMNTNGVNIKSGALVDATHSLHNCTFQQGATGGTLLTINNAQTFTANNAIFPTNTWSGTNNVKKTANQGTVNFNLTTGGFSGSNYESDTYNRIGWTSVNADLSITSFSYASPNPYICDAVNVTITVHNAGTMAINTPFRIDLYHNRLTPPPAGTLGDRYYVFTNLAAGASSTDTFTNVSTATPETWNSYVQIDASQVITESSEGNNVSSPLGIEWRPLPVVGNLTITSFTSPMRVRLDWTYPISVYRYKIYRDTNPYGSFTTLAGTSLTNTFTEAIPTATRYFYRVKAERNLP